MKVESEIYLAVLGDTDLKHHHKNLYLYLLWLSGQEDSRKKGGVFAGNEHLSKQLGSPVYSIADWLEGLEKMGLISRSMKNNKRIITVNPYSANKNVLYHLTKKLVPSNKKVSSTKQKCSMATNKNVLDNIDVNTNINTDVNTGETTGVDWGKDNRSKHPLREIDSMKIITLFNWWKCGNKEVSKEEWLYVPEKQRDLYYVWLEEEMELSRNGWHKIVDERIPFEEVLKQRIVGSPQYNRYIQEMQLA